MKQYGQVTMYAKAFGVSRFAYLVCELGWEAGDARQWIREQRAALR